MLKLCKNFKNGTSVSAIPESSGRGMPYLSKRDPFLYATDHLILSDGCAFFIYDGNTWLQIVNHGAIDINPVSILDTGGRFKVGWDYYIYLCLNEEGQPVLMVSANTTYPDGGKAQNSRKIGGFHFGHIRHVSDDGKWVPVDSTGNKRGAIGTIWQRNVSVGIVPNSVWDLANRPQCSPEGMVKVGSNWVDIYQCSAAETITLEGPGLSIVTGKLQSKYGQLPVTGIEGLNWFGFAELAGLAGKKMLSYAEWIAAARDNPQGEDDADNYGWTKNTNIIRNRTGCNIDSDGNFIEGGGVKPYAVSALNIVDAVGNVHEWLNEFTYREDGPTVGWAWRDVLGTGKGKAWLYKENSLVSLRAGGHWKDGAAAGPRCVSTSYGSWFVFTYYGCRLACDSI